MVTPKKWRNHFDYWIIDQRCLSPSSTGWFKKWSYHEVPSALVGIQTFLARKSRIYRWFPRKRNSTARDLLFMFEPRQYCLPSQFRPVGFWCCENQQLDGSPKLWDFLRLGRLPFNSQNYRGLFHQQQIRFDLHCLVSVGIHVWQLILAGIGCPKDMWIKSYPAIHGCLFVGGWCLQLAHTVDERNPAPVGNYW